MSYRWSTMASWASIAMGLAAITLLLAFFAYSDKVGHDDHPPPDLEDWWDDEVDDD